jgi:acetyltransferase-like isoleucine patch superfamily enzyme
LRSLWIRLLQALALYLPGATSIRPSLHRWRGVHVGQDVFIGTDALIETERPELVFIGDRACIGIRSTIIAHFRGATAAERNEGSEPYSVRICNDAFVGPGTLIMPGVTVGEGAVVSAGSVVTSNVAPMTVVQGNPARAVALSTVPLGVSTPASKFYRGLRPLKR